MSKKTDPLEIAQKQRHVYLLTKVRENKPLSKPEMTELEHLEEMAKAKNTKAKSKKPDNPDLIKSQKEAAEYLGVSVRQLRRYETDGLIGKTADEQYSRSALELFKRLGPKFEHKNRDAKATADLRTVKAKLAEIEFKKETGKLIDAEDEQRRDLEKIYAAKRLILSQGRRIGPQLVGKSKNKILQMLNEDGLYILKVLAGQIQEDEISA